MNVTDGLIYTIPQELIGKFSGLLIVLQALGWAIIFYIVFSVINFIINKKRHKEIMLINKNLKEIKKILQKK